jgi:hypothetical protein
MTQEEMKAVALDKLVIQQETVDRVLASIAQLAIPNLEHSDDICELCCAIAETYNEERKMFP